MSDELLDVLIVGAGPVGLFCANELTRQGLTCRIIDKKSLISDKSKALAIHIRTLDLLNDCGFLEEIISKGLKVYGALFKSKGKELIDATFASLEADRHFLIDLPQDKTERILYKGLIDKGLNIEWQTELTAIEETSDHIVSTLKFANGQGETIQSSWVIACDGSHSTLRTLVNAEFIGSSIKQTWWLADLRIDWELPEDKLIMYVSDKGPLACFPMGEKRYRLVMTAPERILHKEPSMEDIEQAFKLRCSDKATLSFPLWISAFGIDEKQIQKYRYGRVFFAGDAAHVHSPFGGQGMNTGLQDIYNLSWKLALVHKGFAKDFLLDSYQSERHPIAAHVLKRTGFMTYVMMIKNPVLINLRNFILHTAMSFDFIKNSMLYDLAELSVSYAKSPIVKILGRKTNFKIGEFLINFSLIDTNTEEKKGLHQITEGTMHHLFLFTGTTGNSFTLLTEIATVIEQRFAGLLRAHIVLSQSETIPPSDNISVFIDENQKMHQHFVINQSIAVLIRPDKYVGLTQEPVDKDELLNHMENSYFG